MGSRWLVLSALLLGPLVLILIGVGPSPAANADGRLIVPKLIGRTIEPIAGVPQGERGYSIFVIGSCSSCNLDALIASKAPPDGLAGILLIGDRAPDWLKKGAHPRVMVVEDVDKEVLPREVYLAAPVRLRADAHLRVLSEDWGGEAKW